MSNVKKLKLISPLVTILIVLFVSVLLLAMAGTGSTFAFVVEGGDYGLKVTAEEEYTEGGYNDVSNLNPGDTRSSYLTVSNAGSRTFRYFFDIQRISSNSGKYRGAIGEPLEKILQMKVKRGEETLFEGLVTDFNEKNMGNLAAGDEQRLDISVYFPETAGNEYQGADVTVRFKFRAVYEGGGDYGGDYDDYESPPPPGEEELEEPPEIPEVEGPGEKEPPESQDVIEPDEPAVPPTELEVFPELPKTGEFSRPAIYGIGLLIILSGLLLREKARAAKNNKRKV